MSAMLAAEVCYQGPTGYVTVHALLHQGRRGMLFYYANPDPRKLQAVDVTGMGEMVAGLATVEAQADSLDFCVFYGAYDQVHAGADVTQFAGDPDIPAIQAHLYRGTELDTHVKLLWPKLRTIGVLCGDRFGGSVEWPLFAEWGVCDSATRVQFSEVHLGIVPGWNGILNAWLKGGQGNARYMACLGNAVAAAQLQQIGIVQEVVEAPPAPDRKAMVPEEYQAAWSAHAAHCQNSLLEVALTLATQEQPLIRRTGSLLPGDDGFTQELTRRLDPAPYRELRERIAAEMQAVTEETEKEKTSELNKLAAKELARLGKPLAPAAVAAVEEFFQRWGGLTAGEIFQQYDEIGHHEADLCTKLMRTDHRRIGVGAVLSRNPVERIPVFE